MINHPQLIDIIRAEHDLISLGIKINATNMKVIPRRNSRIEVDVHLSHLCRDHSKIWIARIGILHQVIPQLP